MSLLHQQITTSFFLVQAKTKADMASSIVRGLVTNYGIDRQHWHRPSMKRKLAAAPTLVVIARKILHNARKRDCCSNALKSQNKQKRSFISRLMKLSSLNPRILGDLDRQPSKIRSLQNKLIPTSFPRRFPWLQARENALGTRLN